MPKQKTKKSAAKRSKEDETKGIKVDKANIMCVQIKLEKKKSQNILHYDKP